MSGLEIQVLTHILCLLIMCRSMSSLILRYFSSDSGLWPTESSASGSGLSQPFRPFFLRVCKYKFAHSSNTNHNDGPRVGYIQVVFRQFENHSCRAHFRIWGKLSQNNYVWLYTVSLKSLRSEDIKQH